MDEQQRLQISVEECGEICDRILAHAYGLMSAEDLWVELWLGLTKEFDRDPLLRPPANAQEANDPASTKARVVEGITNLISQFSEQPEKCMDVFKLKVESSARQ